MAQQVKYKKPRRINPVSVVVVLALATVAYLAYQYLPMFLQKEEAYRVLEETSSRFSGRRGYYVQESKPREMLRRQMENDIRRLGIDDPDIETWIEIDDTEVHFGVVYSVWLTWPFEVIAKQEVEYHVEHVLKIPKRR